MKLVIASVLAGTVLVVAVPLARADVRPRPNDAPHGQIASVLAPNELQIYNDYPTDDLTYSARRAVVHYVSVGVDAPPLNDDDADRVPDYVERVGVAADDAIDYYERRGFARILPDDAGPDARPDLYVSRFAPGYFGVAFPAARARGGAFVVVSNALDPSPERSLGSLYGTVAHELFHLVQFSYFPRTVAPEIPGWVLEGTAAAMEGRVYPQLADIVGSLQLRSWFDRPQASLTGQTYGSQLLWRYLDERRRRLLPGYLRRLATCGPGWSAAAGLAAAYARITGRPFARAFGEFAVWVAGDFESRITPLRTLAAGARAQGRVQALSIHFLHVPRSTAALHVRVAAGAPTVALVYQQLSVYAGHAAVARLLPGRPANGATVFRIPPSLRESPRFGAAMLVVANGDPDRRGGYSVAVERKAPETRGRKTTKGAA